MSIDWLRMIEGIVLIVISYAVGLIAMYLYISARLNQHGFRLKQLIGKYKPKNPGGIV